MKPYETMKYETMKTETISMSEEEFWRIPRKFGWKYMYYEGAAQIQPQEWGVYARVPVTRRQVHSALTLRPVAPADMPELKTAFFECFYDSVEYCDCSEKTFASSAERCVGGWTRHRRGSPMDVSRIAVTVPTPDEPAQIVGAALVALDAVGPLLDVLYARPAWRQQGVATALVGDVMNALHEQGWSFLCSSYHPANDASVAWHKRFGFVDEADLHLTLHRLYHARDELQRREDIGDMTMREREILERIVKIYEDLWQHQADIADAEGMAVVSPILRHHAKRDY